MKTKDFKLLLDKVNKVIENKNSLPILDNCFLNDGWIKVSDLDVTYSVKCDILNGFNGLVNFNNLYKIFKKLKNVDFKVSQKNDKFIIHTPKGDVSLKLDNNTEDFPHIEAKYELFDTLSTKESELIRKALKYIARDELRPVLNTVLIDSDHVVASDSHRLCFYKTSKLREKSFMVKPKAAMLVQKCEVFKSDKYLKFVSEDEVIEQRMQEGNFPSWKAILPTNNNVLSLDPKSFLEQLDLCLISGDKIQLKSKLSLCDSVYIHSEDLDNETEFKGDVIGDYIGDNMDIGFNTKFMMEILKHEGYNDIIDITFSDPSRAMVINNDVILIPMSL